MIFPSPTASSPIPFAASTATVPPPVGSATAKISQHATMSPRSAASLAPAFGFFHAARPTTTARMTTRTAAPVTPPSSLCCKIRSTPSRAERHPEDPDRPAEQE